ncbi:hypothetical protein E2C01_002276 [Portunus trituberculatus]|uniref:Uncharacterized protein n=1 Tax=Portunus trituberculatus TaxID=210409 RepID=A0A5B7CJZ2_PORTR|nr:hypothetical protein [Portunus trituberculatus]
MWKVEQCCLGVKEVEVVMVVVEVKVMAVDVMVLTGAKFMVMEMVMKVVEVTETKDHVTQVSTRVTRAGRPPVSHTPPRKPQRITEPHGLASSDASHSSPRLRLALVHNVHLHFSRTAFKMERRGPCAWRPRGAGHIP